MIGQKRLCTNWVTNNQRVSCSSIILRRWYQLLQSRIKLFGLLAMVLGLMGVVITPAAAQSNLRQTLHDWGNIYSGVTAGYLYHQKSGYNISANVGYNANFGMRAGLAGGYGSFGGWLAGTVGYSYRFNIGLRLTANIGLGALWSAQGSAQGAVLMGYPEIAVQYDVTNNITVGLGTRLFIYPDYQLGIKNPLYAEVGNSTVTYGTNQVNNEYEVVRLGTCDAESIDQMTKQFYSDCQGALFVYHETNYANNYSNLAFYRLAAENLTLVDYAESAFKTNHQIRQDLITKYMEDSGSKEQDVIRIFVSDRSYENVSNPNDITLYSGYIYKVTAVDPNAYFLSDNRTIILAPEFYADVSFRF